MLYPPEGGRFTAARYQKDTSMRKKNNKGLKRIKRKGSVQLELREEELAEVNGGLLAGPISNTASLPDLPGLPGLPGWPPAPPPLPWP
ncbi:MAG: hypothetical protein K0V04_22830 [Deltaproteobacteria bacterium]|nr:hypothetical protein [Deltaproteobacteria bacterium]